MPPVLHVTLHKLPRSSAQQVSASDISIRHHQRHHILQLVAETVSPTVLVERSATPDPAGESLVKQPAIDQDVHRSFGSGDLHCSEHVVPLPLDLQQDLLKVGRAVAANQFAGLVAILSLSQKNYKLNAFVGAQLDSCLQHRTRIKPGTYLSGERSPSLQGRRPLGRAIAAEELSAITRPRSLPAAEV